MTAPHFGYTKQEHGEMPVHLKTHDHLPGSNIVVRFNSRLAVLVTKVVGTMWCAYVFAIFDLLALPTALQQGLYGIVQWVASFFLQLVLLSVIMVGQNLQITAADARAAKQFDDTETIVDRLDTRTQGGLKEVMDAITDLSGKEH
jgi:hypothetical protein